MYGTLRGALAGRKIVFDRESYTATVEGRIIGIGKTIRIKSIHMKYVLAVPAESREATERALTLHPEGCPAHQSVQGAIEVTWEARVRFGAEEVTLRGAYVPCSASIRETPTTDRAPRVRSSARSGQRGRRSGGAEQPDLPLREGHLDPAGPEALHDRL